MAKKRSSKSLVNESNADHAEIKVEFPHSIIHLPVIISYYRWPDENEDFLLGILQRDLGRYRALQPGGRASRWIYCLLYRDRKLGVFHVLVRIDQVGQSLLERYHVRLPRTISLIFVQHANKHLCNILPAPFHHH